MVQILYKEQKYIVNKPASLDQLISSAKAHFKLTEQVLLTSLNGFTLARENFNALHDNASLVIVLGDKVDVNFVEDCPPQKSMAKDMGNLNYTLVPALCEPIDNSLQSTIPFKDRSVKVTVKRDSGEFQIYDNGLGMTHEQIKSWATLGSGSYVNQIEKSNSELRNKAEIANWDTRIYAANSSHISLVPYHTSKLSRYGVGVKYSAAKLGDHFEAVSLSQDSEYVHTAAWDTVSSEWKIRFSSRTADAEEQQRKHFTIVNINSQAAQRENHQGLFPISLDSGAFDIMLAKNLAQIYYYYIHGPQKLESKIRELTPAQTKLDSLRTSKEVPRPLDDINFTPVDFRVNGKMLSEIQDLAEDEYLAKAKSCFPVRFDLKALHKDKTVTETTVQGCIFYYPFENGKETLPLIEAAVDDPTIIQKRISGVEYFWVGRLMPKSKPDMLPFMVSPKSKMDSKKARKPAANSEFEVPIYCYGRVRGMFFFDREFEVTQNKTEFVASNAFFTKFLQMCSDATLCDKYQRWLERCHKYDHEAIFVGKYEYVDKEQRTYYTELVLRGVEIKAGDYVAFEDTNGKTIIGKALTFFHDSTPHQTSNGSCKVQVWTHKPTHEETPSLSQTMNKLDKKEFEAHVEKCKNLLPARLEATNLPEEIAAGSALEKVVVVIKNAKGNTISNYSDNGKKLTLEICKVMNSKIRKVSTTISKSSFTFATVGFEDGIFQECGDYKLTFTCDFGEENNLVLGPLLLKVIHDQPHHLEVIEGDGAKFQIGSEMSFKLACYDKFQNRVPFTEEEVSKAKFITTQCKKGSGDRFVNNTINASKCNLLADGSVSIVGIKQVKPSIGSFKFIFNLQTKFDCHTFVEITAGPPVKLIISQFPREKEFINMQVLPKIVLSLLDAWDNPAAFDSRSAFKLEVTGTCVNRTEFPLTNKGEFEVDRLVVQSMFLKQVKEIRNTARQSSNSDQEWIGQAFDASKGMSNEVDYAGVFLNKRAFYVGDIVSVGTRSTTRAWFGQIDRLFEDYRGQRVSYHYLVKSSEAGLEGDNHQLLLSSEKAVDNELDARVEMCYIVNHASYRDLLSLAPEAIKPRLFWCDSEYNSVDKTIKPTKAFGSAQDILRFWLVDANGNMLLHTQQSITIIPDYSPKFLRVLPPSNKGIHISVNEKTLNTNPPAELELLLSLTKSPSLTISGIMVELVNEALLCCKGIRGTILPIEGWTEDEIDVTSPCVTLPDLEYVLSHQTVSFEIEFVPHGNDKAKITNSLKLTVKSGVPCAIKLTAKTSQIECGVPMPKLDVKITDTFGNLCTIDPTQHPSLSVHLQHIDAALTSALPNINKDWQFALANQQKTNLAHYVLEDFIVEGFSGFYKLIVEDLEGADLEGAMDIELCAGPPTQLNCKPDEKPEVQNGQVWKDFAVTLIDACKPPHIASKLQDAKLQISSISPGFHFPALSIEQNDGLFTVPPIKISQIAGEYKLELTATWREKKISKRLIKEITLTVVPGTNPHKFTLVQPDNEYNWEFTAGDTLPEIKVNLMAENNTIIKLAEDNMDVNMVVKIPTGRDITYLPVIDASGTISFQNTSKLSYMGNYSLQITYKKGLPLRQSFSVLTGLPVKFGPQNSSVMLNNITQSGPLLAAPLTLVMFDSENNETALRSSLSLSLSIHAVDESANAQTPTLRITGLAWTSGNLIVPALVVDGNPRVPSGEYVLVFTPSKSDILPLRLSFLYSDGAEMRELHEKLSQVKADCLQMESKHTTLMMKFKEISITHAEKKRRRQQMQMSMGQGVRHLPNAEAMVQLEQAKMMAETMQERSSEIKHHQMKQTLQQLKGGALRVTFIGIVAELAFCPDATLAELFSEHLGNKMCSVVTQSFQQQDAIKDVLRQQRLPAVPVINMELLRKKRPPTILQNTLLDLGPVNAPGFKAHAVNMLEIPGDNGEMRAYLWYHLFGKAMVFDTNHNARQYMQSCYTQQGHSPTLFVTTTKERISGDGFEMAGVSTHQPAAIFGLTPISMRGPILLYRQVMQQIEEHRAQLEQAKQVDFEIGKLALQEANLGVDLDKLTAQLNEIKKQRDMLQRKIESDSAHRESALSKRRRT